MVKGEHIPKVCVTGEVLWREVKFNLRPEAGVEGSMTIPCGSLYLLASARCRGARCRGRLLFF